MKIEVGREYYFLGDEKVVLHVTAVSEWLVDYKYITPSRLADGSTHQWSLSDFLDDHRLFTKLHRLLKGIE